VVNETLRNRLPGKDFDCPRGFCDYKTLRGAGFNDLVTARRKIRNRDESALVGHGTVYQLTAEGSDLEFRSGEGVAVCVMR